MVEIMSFIGISFVTVFSLMYAIVTSFKMKNIKAELSQEKINVSYIRSELAKTLLELESNKLEKTEGFVKFISESRDWAFQYIEDVQQSINAVKHDWDNNNQMEESIEILFTFLPEENKEK